MADKITVVPEDFIQDGTVTTLGAAGEIVKVQELNPQQLATDQTKDKLLVWLAENIPEGNPWSARDLYAGNNANYQYNCPCWQAVAANQQQFNCGLLWQNLFYYPVPTQSTLDELHTLASGPAPTQ